MIFKKGIMMLISNKGDFDGIYAGDLRIFRNFDVDVDLNFIEVMNTPQKNVRYLKQGEKVAGVLTAKTLFGDENVILIWKLKAFDNIRLKITPSVNVEPADLMSMRGFGNVDIECKRTETQLKISSPGMLVNIRLNYRGFGEYVLKKGECVEGKLEAHVGCVFREKIAHVLENSKTEGFSDLMDISEDLVELSVPTKYGMIPVAGLPWYGAFFGRDLLIFGLQTVEKYPMISKRILKFLAKLQGESVDSGSEEEPGKIIHEVRIGPNGLVYYGTVDATPLFVLLASKYFKKTADRDFARFIKSHLLKAIEWCERLGDVDGDGLLEYEIHGLLRNKGWKDSNEAVVHKNGCLAEGPVALIEVQGYLYASYLEVADLLEISGEKELAVKLERRAYFIKRKVEDLFRTDEYFAMALDGKKKKVETVTSNPAHTLYTGIFSRESASVIVERLMKDDIFTIFGIRTMSSGEISFNPVSYHNGSIWPHDNWFIVKGLLKYGFVEEAKEIVRSMIRASEYFGGKLPELFVYVDGFSKPLPYPGACDPQLWSVGSQFAFKNLSKEVGVS